MAAQEKQHSVQAPPSPLPPAQSQAEWKQSFEDRWALGRRKVPLPQEDCDWKALYVLKPFERNLLHNSNPEGLNVYEPAPLRDAAPRMPLDSEGLSADDPAPLRDAAPRMPLDSEGTFKGWQVSIEPLAVDSKEASSPGHPSPRYSWCVKQQCVDLLAEGLWKELLDSYQPDITIMDWYENSKLADSVYELHVRLLGADGTKVMDAFQHVACESKQEGGSKDWFHVSHVFKSYGPGVRHVHFLHKTKSVEKATGLLRTRATDSSVSVQLRD